MPSARSKWGSTLNPTPWAATIERITRLEAFFTAGSGDARGGAERTLSALHLTLRRESRVAAYGDAFTLLGVLLVVAIPLVLLLGGPARPAAKREVVRHLRGR